MRALSRVSVILTELVKMDFETLEEGVVTGRLFSALPNRCRGTR